MSGGNQNIFFCMCVWIRVLCALSDSTSLSPLITCAILSLIPDFCIPKSPEYLVLPPVFSFCRLGKQQHVLQMALSCTFAEWQPTDQTEHLRVERIWQPCVLIYISDLQNTGKSRLSCPFGWWGLITFILRADKWAEMARSHIPRFVMLWDSNPSWLSSFAARLNLCAHLCETLEAFSNFLL